MQQSTWTPDSSRSIILNLVLFSPDLSLSYIGFPSCVIIPIMSHDFFISLLRFHLSNISTNVLSSLFNYPIEPFELLAGSNGVNSEADELYS